MTPNEYQQQALRTEVTPLFVNDANGVPSKPLSRLVHALLGMNTEQAELQDMLTQHAVFNEPFDAINVVEEAGDQAWYIGLGLDALELTMGDALIDVDFAAYALSFNQTPSYTVTNGPLLPSVMSRISRGQSGVNVAQADCADLYKKLFIYGKPVDKEAVRQTFRQQLIFLQLLLVECGYSLEAAMELNIKKLEKRYPQKFTREQALNRDIAAERSVLEGGLKNDKE